MHHQKPMPQSFKTALSIVAVCSISLCLSACIVEPAPEAEGYPCCYASYEYPGYYYGHGYGYGEGGYGYRYGGGGRRWR